MAHVGSPETRVSIHHFTCHVALVLRQLHCTGYERHPWEGEAGAVNIFSLRRSFVRRYLGYDRNLVRQEEACPEWIHTRGAGAVAAGRCGAYGALARVGARVSAVAVC